MDASGWYSSMLLWDYTGLGYGLFFFFFFKGFLRFNCLYIMNVDLLKLRAIQPLLRK